MKSNIRINMLLYICFWVLVIAAPLIMERFARKPGPEQQSAAGIGPAIDCLNGWERSWRIALAAYQYQYQMSLSQPPGTAQQHPFSDQIMRGTGLRESGLELCADSLGDMLRAYGTYPDMTELAVHYTASMRALKYIDQKLDDLYRTPSGNPPSSEQINLHAQLLPAAADLFKASLALRDNLEYYETRIRATQLNRLVENRRPDQHWYTLNFMLQARLAIDKLDSATRQRTLTPTQLQLIDQQLHAIWRDSDAYMARHPKLVGAQSGLDQMTLWGRINEHAEAGSFMAAVDQLLLDWRSHREPALLSADYQYLGEAYDKMLDQYNIGAAAY